MKKLILMLLLTLCASIAYGQAAKDSGARQPDQWLDVPNTTLEMSFKDDWDARDENDTLVAVSPDGKVHFMAAAVKAKSWNEAATKNKDVYGDWMHDLAFAKEAAMKKSSGLQIFSTGGTALSKTGDEPLAFDMDIISFDGKLVMVVIFGSQDALKEHAADIELTRKSFKKAN